jgi:hypothetical protein
MPNAKKWSRDEVRANLDRIFDAAKSEGPQVISDGADEYVLALSRARASAGLVEFLNRGGPDKGNL